MKNFTQVEAKWRNETGTIYMYFDEYGDKRYDAELKSGYIYTFSSKQDASKFLEAVLNKEHKFITARNELANKHLKYLNIKSAEILGGRL